MPQTIIQIHRDLRLKSREDARRFVMAAALYVLIWNEWGGVGAGCYVGAYLILRAIFD